jgi:hypothetical protein
VCNSLTLELKQQLAQTKPTGSFLADVVQPSSHHDQVYRRETGQHLDRLAFVRNLNVPPVEASTAKPVDDHLAYRFHGRLLDHRSGEHVRITAHRLVDVGPTHSRTLRRSFPRLCSRHPAAG